MWLWSAQVDEILIQSLGQIQCAEVPQCLSCNQGFFDTLTWGHFSPFPTPSSPDKTISSIPLKNPLDKRNKLHSTAD